MVFRRATLPAVLSWADKPVMIDINWNTYLIACQCYNYIACTGAQLLSVCVEFHRVGGTGLFPVPTLTPPYVPFGIRRFFICDETLRNNPIETHNQIFAGHHF